MKYEIIGTPKELNDKPRLFTVLWDNGKATASSKDRVTNDLWADEVIRMLEEADFDLYGQTLFFYETNPEDGSYNILGRCKQEDHITEPICFRFLVNKVMEEGYKIKTILDDGTEIDRWPMLEEVYGPFPAQGKIQDRSQLKRKTA